MLQKHDDILGAKYNVGPYVACSKSSGHWMKKNPIDLTNYFDWASDEAINCSKFAVVRAARKILYQIDILSQQNTNHTFACPMDEEKLKAMQVKYGKISEKIINATGIGKQ